jgi:hypothetical protein
LFHQFPVNESEADQIETVAEELGLHNLVIGAGAAERWTHVDFQEPWLQLGIDQDVEAIDLKAGVLVLGATAVL